MNLTNAFLKMIPEDSRVEIDAKIHAGYCKRGRVPIRLFSLLTASPVTTGKIMTMEELSAVKGRAWEDVDVSASQGHRYWYYSRD